LITFSAKVGFDNYGSLTVSGIGSLNLSSGTGSFANSATITGTVSISTGTLDVNGTFNATGGNITFSGAGNLNLGGATNTYRKHKYCNT
jgi:hypothetical protein